MLKKEKGIFILYKLTDMSLIINDIYEYSLRDIPKMDILLSDEKIKKLKKEFSYEVIKNNLFYAVDEIREKIKLNDQVRLDFLCLKDDIYNKDGIIKALIFYNLSEKLNKLFDEDIKKVINATGIVLHTNLGRGIISKEISKGAIDLLSSYSSLEYDIEKGKRGDRNKTAKYLRELINCEDAVFVNNNAAAVFLILNTFAKKKKVIVSRGELVEIGGSFRVPDIMSASGAKLVEIGTTNKTHLRDYINAVDEKTSMILKVHPSNYRIDGFVEGVSCKEIKENCKDKLLVYDLGSGLLFDELINMDHDEPSAKNAIVDGCDLICFSGDKLFGASQLGIIAGKKELIDRIKKNSLLRALRADKLSLYIAQKTLKEYIRNRNSDNNLMIYRMINADKDTLRERANRLCLMIGKGLNGNFRDKIYVSETISYVGGGSLPDLELKGYGVFIEIKKVSAASKRLRQKDIPIICIIKDDKLVFDVRTISDEDFEYIAEALQGILKENYGV